MIVDEGDDDLVGHFLNLDLSEFSFNRCLYHQTCYAPMHGLIGRDNVWGNNGTGLQETQPARCHDVGLGMVG